MTQLYSVRSRESWGVGDFGDLAGLAAWGADLGAEFVLVNPLHAAEPVPPVEDSPYLPTSRRYLNPLYVRVTDVPELAALLDATTALGSRRSAPAPFDDADGLLDRQPSYAAKLAALDLVHAAPRSPERERELQAFCRAGGPGAAPVRRSGARSPSTSPARSGRPSCRDPASPAVAALADQLADRVDFFVLAAVGRRRAARGRPGARPSTPG